MARAGLAATDGEIARFKDLYFGMLVEEVDRPAPWSGNDPANPRHFKGILPGVSEALGALLPRRDVFLALLTGNYARAAEIKLAHFGLWQHFPCGAFGEDAVERWQLVQVAADRARALGSPVTDPRDMWVIGDTPLDVEAAHKAGVRCVGVATGGSTVEVLARAGADVAVDRLGASTFRV